MDLKEYILPKNSMIGGWYIPPMICDDIITLFKDKGVQLIIDAKSLIYIDGTEVDYQKDGLNEGFEFNNPNSKAECGCGESFTV